MDCILKSEDQDLKCENCEEDGYWAIPYPKWIEKNRGIELQMQKEAQQTSS